MKLKRVLVIALSMVMTFSMIPAGVASAAESELEVESNYKAEPASDGTYTYKGYQYYLEKLSDKCVLRKKNISTNKSKKIKSHRPICYESSDVNVAKVNKKGMGIETGEIPA